MKNKENKHTENGLVQNSMLTYNTGFNITVNIGTGVDGETTALFIRDSNLYPDSDSRSKRNPEFIIPFDDTEDLNVLVKLLNKSIEERNLTLIKFKKYTIFDIIKELLHNNISASIQYHMDLDEFYIELDTQSKSEIRLYQDGTIRGRYDYENEIDFTKPMSDIMYNLGEEFIIALHGRSYGAHGWFQLCKKLNIEIPKNLI